MHSECETTTYSAATAMTRSVVLHLLGASAASLCSAARRPQPPGHSLDLRPAKGVNADLKLLTYCQQTALKCFFVGAEWDLPLSLFFPVHIWAVSHFTLRVCQNSTPSAAKYHKNKHSHRRCWTSHVQQLTDSAWKERIRSRSFSTSSLDALTGAAPSPLDVSRLYSVSRLWRWYVVKNNNGRNTRFCSPSWFCIVLSCTVYLDSQF